MCMCVHVCMCVCVCRSSRPRNTQNAYGGPYGLVTSLLMSHARHSKHSLQGVCQCSNVVGHTTQICTPADPRYMMTLWLKQCAKTVLGSVVTCHQFATYTFLTQVALCCVTPHTVMQGRQGGECTFTQCASESRGQATTSCSCAQGQGTNTQDIFFAV